MFEFILCHDGIVLGRAWMCGGGGNHDRRIKVEEECKDIHSPLIHPAVYIGLLVLQPFGARAVIRYLDGSEANGDPSGGLGHSR